MNRLRTACAVSALVIFIACAQKQTDANGDGIADGVVSPNAVSQVVPSSPVGTISGMVLNANKEPLADVNVTLVLGIGGTDGAYTATTATNGTYVFKNVPGGSSAELFYSKSGFTSAHMSTSVPGSSGNFPLNNGNGNGGIVTLAQLNETLKFTIFTAQGRPAKVKAFLEFDEAAFQSFTGGSMNSVGTFTSAEVTADDTGLLTFSGMPSLSEVVRLRQSGTVTLTIGALENNGLLEALGVIRNFTVEQLFTRTQPGGPIILGDPRETGTLAISATNLDSFLGSGTPPYRNAVAANGAINIVFSQPVAEGATSRLVKVMLEDCQTEVPVTATWRTNVLSITPSTSWTMGSRYNVLVRATGFDTGSTNQYIGYFFALDASRTLGTSGSFDVRKTPGALNPNATAMQPTDTLYAMFDTPISLQINAPLRARAFIDFDLNDDAVIGGNNGAGEFNSPFDFGLSVDIDEPTSAANGMGTFSCKTSGYSSRWRVTVNNFPNSNLIPAGTSLKVIFPKQESSSLTYQTASGAPVSVEVNGKMKILP